MPGIRDALASVVCRTGVVHAIQFGARLMRPNLTVLAYHRVLPRVRVDEFDFDIELVSAWQDEFEWQVKYLSREFNVITCRDLVGLIDRGSRLPDRMAMLTFDDGFRDNHRIAWPILKAHKVPAIVFVATGYVGTERPYWYDRLAYSVNRTTLREIRALAPTGELFRWNESRASRATALKSMLSLLKKLPQRARLAQIDAWHEELGVSEPNLLGTVQSPMNWTELKELSAGGIEIGSHTVSHPVLSQIEDTADLESELLVSKHALEAALGGPVMSMAYPVGGPEAYNARVMEQVRRSGYRFAFTYTPGRNDPSAWNPLTLGRLAVERYTTRDRFRAMLASSFLA